LSEYPENSNQNDQPANEETGWRRLLKLGTRQKTAISAVIVLLAIALAINSSVIYESRNNTGNGSDHPPPTYTGSAPLNIDIRQEALDSNNDFIMVITPCADPEVNQTVTETVVAAGDKIRTTDDIYVGVFKLPLDDSLDYPVVFTRLMNRGDSFLYQVTLREDITLDLIYDTYLSRKFLRE